jgi:hypothetical protein
LSGLVDGAVARADDPAVRGVQLSTVGAVCAILTTASFVTGGILLGTSGVEVLIPPTGADGLEWIADVDEAGETLFVGAWLIVLTTLVGAVALVGFHDALAEAGPSTVLAPIVGVIGLTLVTISHLVPIALAYEFVPGFVAADEATKASLAVTFDTLASMSAVLNYVGNALGWGVAVPIFALAILQTSVVPRWIGWLGLFVAVVAGWLGLFSPASSVVEGITVIGFVAFFAFMLCMGVALLRRHRRVAA